MTEQKGGHPKGSKLSEVYGPVKFEIPILRFKKQFVLFYLDTHPDSGRMQLGQATITTPQDLIDFQVKLTAGKVQMMEGLSLSVQLFIILSRQLGLQEEAGTMTKMLTFKVPEGPVPTDVPQACGRRLWTGTETGGEGETVCQHPNRNQEMKCERVSCPDPIIQDDSRYW